MVQTHEKTFLHMTNKILRNLIDNLLIRKKYKNGLYGVRTYLGTDAGSYHNPVVGNLKLGLKQLRRTFKKRININNLKNEEV